MFKYLATHVLTAPSDLSCVPTANGRQEHAHMPTKVRFTSCSLTDQVVAEANH